MAQPKSWSVIKPGLKYFQDEAFILLLEKIEAVLIHHNHPHTLQQFKVTREELDRNKELRTLFESLHANFEKISSQTISNINTLLNKTFMKLFK